MTAKEYLEQGIYINRAIEENILELERIDSEICRCTQVFTGRHIQRGTDNGTERRVIEHINKYDSIIDEVRRETEELSEVKRSIRRRIYGILEPKYRLLLSKRYIRFLKWERIQEELGYKETKSVYRLHKAAVDEFIRVHGNEL